MRPGGLGRRGRVGSYSPLPTRATAKSRKTGRGVPANPGPIGGLKNKLDADGRGSGNPRTFSVHPRYFAFSLVYPADHSPTAQFGQDFDFAVTRPSPCV